MRPIRDSLALTLAAVTTLAPLGQASAAPVVIRDDLLKDLSITPAVGRGYSVATNTFQSICFETVEKTNASFNFYYKFEQTEAGSGAASLALSTTAAQGGQATTTDTSGQAQGGQAGVTGGAATQAGQFIHAMSATVTVDVYYASLNESKSKLATDAKALLAANDIPGFFDGCGPYFIRSINRRGTFFSRFEYKTKTAARDVVFESQLEAQIQGFGNQAVGAASGVPQGTPAFASTAAQVVSNAAAAAAGPVGGTAVNTASGPQTGQPPGTNAPKPPGTTTGTTGPTTGTTGPTTGTTTTTPSVPTTGTPPPATGPAGTTVAALMAANVINQAQLASFAEAASSRQLTIESTAEGLGKPKAEELTGDGAGLSLIAYDVATFKTAIANAFKAMMRDDAGMVTSMEVTPWTDNVNFQAAIGLMTPDAGGPGAAPPTQTATTADVTAPPPPAAGAVPGAVPGAPGLVRNPKSPYEKKRILNLNGEFLSEVDRSTRGRLLAYYRMKLCREELEVNWFDPPRNKEGKVKMVDGPGPNPVPAARSLNHKTGAKIPTTKLIEETNDAKLKAAWDDYDKFMFQDALGCVKALLASDIIRVRYLEVAQCKGIEAKLPFTSSMIVAEHCMPTLVP